MGEAISFDGTKVCYFDEGRGPAIVFVHGGSQAAADWAEVAGELVDRYRVVRIERSVYAKSRAIAAHTMAREVDDVACVLARLGEPAILVGHSSGGIVALETALRSPSALAGLVLYEPPVAVFAPLGGEALDRAEAAIARGDKGEAIAIFLSCIVRYPASLVALGRRVRPAWEEMSRLAAEQIADGRAIESLGVGIDRYRAIDLPALLVGGWLSPAHLRDRLAALADVLPRAETVILRRAGHLANMWWPKKLAAVIEDFVEANVGSQTRRVG